MNEVSAEKWWKEIVLGEDKRTPSKTYPDSVSSATKPTWIDRDANSELQREEESGSHMPWAALSLFLLHNNCLYCIFSFLNKR